MSVANLIDRNTGLISVQMLPGFVASDVRNPMIVSLDANGFDITDAGAVESVSVKTSTLTLASQTPGGGDVNLINTTGAIVELNTDFALVAPGNTIFTGGLDAQTEITSQGTLTVAGVATFSDDVVLTSGKITSVDAEFSGTLETGGAIRAGGTPATADIFCNTLHYNNLNPAIVGTSPVGAVEMYAGAVGTLPAGWLLCDGSSVSQATFAGLFAVVGTTFGAGAPGTFNLPDLRGRFPIGVGVGGGGNYALGAQGGALNKTLAVSEMPTHSHGITDPGHSHTYDTKNTTSSYTIAGSTYWKDDSTVSTGTSTTGITINNTGGGNAFSLLNPCLALNFIIKT